MNVLVDPGLECMVDDFLWPWEESTPVLLQHGFARNPHFWDGWAPLLSASRRLYRPFVRGCGGSPVPRDDFEYSPESLAGDLIRILDHFSIEKVHYVGEASGGILGIVLALTVPDRVASLVLCNTPTAIPSDIKAKHSLGAAQTRDAILLHGVRQWCLDTITTRLDSDRVDPRLVAWYADEMNKTPRHVAAALSVCFESANVAEALRELRVPTLLLGGDDRTALAAEQQEAMEREIPVARRRSIPGWGRAIHVVAPGPCVEEAVSFWNDVESDAASLEHADARRVAS